MRILEISVQLLILSVGYFAEEAQRNLPFITSKSSGCEVSVVCKVFQETRVYHSLQKLFKIWMVVLEPIGTGVKSWRVPGECKGS